MGSESNDFLSPMRLFRFYYLIYSFSMKIEVCICNISTKRKNCRLHGGIKNEKIANLINHNTVLSGPWLWTVKHKRK